jgi:KDO2-lipid IV(A) lauroyltransferase
VIYNNISLSFPEKSPAEIKKIVKGTYNNLAEVMVDTICLAGAKRRNDLNHVTWINLDKHLERTKGRDWIFMSAHYGCWEYFLLWTLIDPDSHIMGVYHPVKSVVFEHFYRRLRNFGPNVHQVTMQETVRHYIKNRGKDEQIVLGLISDQTPNLRPDTEWYDFLNRKTAFIDGSEKLAMRFKIPVYFTHIERIKAGHIAIRLDEIYDGVEEVEPNEITRRYAAALEKMIKERPELWMWSHKRWKHNPEKQLRRFGKMTKSAEQ